MVWVGFNLKEGGGWLCVWCVCVKILAQGIWELSNSHRYHGAGPGFKPQARLASGTDSVLLGLLL